MLTAAVALEGRRRGWRSSAPALSVLGALMVYVWLLFHSCIWVYITWQVPEERPHTFVGLESLGNTLALGNALWALLLVAKLVEVIRGPRHARRGSLAPLLMALLVVAMLQKFALVIMEVAQW